jgi:hypothetical protein
MKRRMREIVGSFGNDMLASRGFGTIRKKLIRSILVETCKFLT